MMSYDENDYDNIDYDTDYDTGYEDAIPDGAVFHGGHFYASLLDMPIRFLFSWLLLLLRWKLYWLIGFPIHKRLWSIKHRNDVDDIPF